MHRSKSHFRHDCTWLPACLLMVAAFFVGCDQATVNDLNRAAGTAHEVLSIPPSRAPGAVRRAGPSNVPAKGDTLLIASFNIQVFGTSKLSKPDVASVLADVVRKFDVVAIQEIRARDQDLLDRFIDLVNATGQHYRYLLGPRIGRTSSKEQYAYLYDEARVEYVAGTAYTLNDEHDLLHREPLIATFRTRAGSATESFSFTLVNVHTDPDEATEEVALMDDVVNRIRKDDIREDDVILLGDFNAGERDFGELVRDLPDVSWAIRGIATNTRGTQMYDNIIFEQRLTSEFTGRSGVVDLLSEYGLTVEQALQVSDHLPIWAEFRPWEDQPPRLSRR